METIKAFVRTSATNQQVKLTEVPIPDIQPDEVLVKVKAFGVGIHDRYFIPQDANFPYVIGSEGAGIIEKAGNKVFDFAVGDRVLFTTTLQPQGGSWAEYAAANKQSLLRLPDTLSFEMGATVPIAGKTALECMRALNLEKNEKLFIAGASGAIGTFVIQLAAAKGIRISASASQKNHAYMESLRAEKAVDYHNPNWQDEIKKWSDGGVAAALAIQPGTGADSLKVVKEGGKLITVSGDSAQVVPERNITVKQMQHHPDTRQRIIDLIHSIANGTIKVVIEKEYEFEDALQALEKTETRHARGKLVVSGIN